MAQDLPGSPQPSATDPLPDGPGPWQPPEGHTVGIAVSGGGVRSAAFAFGGLQALQQRRGLIHGPGRADYLCAVSGGSYIASAILSAYGGHLNTPTRPWPGRSWDVDSSSVTAYGHPRYAAEVAAEQPGSPWNLYHRLRVAKPISAPWRTVAASDPLRPGAPESDYLRVHARYMLEGNVAITLARFLALVLIPMAATLASVVLAGWAARRVQESFSGDVAIIPIALAILAVYLLVLAQRDTAERRVALGSYASRSEYALSDAAVAIFLVALLGLFAWTYATYEQSILTWVGTSSQNLLTKVLALGGVSTAALGPSLLALVRGQLKPKADSTSKKSRAGAWGRAAMILLVQALLLVLVPATAVAAFIVGWKNQPWAAPLATTPVQAAAVVVVVLFTLYVVFGDHALSPHAKYRALLERAFSFVRQERTEEVAWQALGPQQAFRVIRRPISPPLSELNRQDIPLFLICASVNITEQGVAAAGSYARPIIFSPYRIYISGDPGGGMLTKDYERVIGRPRWPMPHSFDGTLMSYVALTGAAVSPSMGRFSKYWLRQVMTILNLRLGAWIPNPAWAGMPPEGTQATLQRWLNRAPGPLLWWREFRGRHYISSKYIYVSDGGHYENLGIVELIRLGCHEIWSFDASNDDRGTWRSLAESLNLAASELGCTIEGDFSAFESAPEDEDPRRRLIRDTHTSVTITGVIGGAQAWSCVLHVVKLGMSAQTNPVVTELAARYPKFPYDSTVNQIYSAERFDLYRQLGFDSCSRALDALDAQPAAAQDPVSADSVPDDSVTAEEGIDQGADI